jgi:hypothetical protein
MDPKSAYYGLTMSNTAHDAGHVTTIGGDRKELPPGPVLYREVLAGFVRRVDPPRSLAVWCKQVGIPRSTVMSALFGLSDTDEARELRRKAMIAAGLLAEVDR